MEKAGIGPAFRFLARGSLYRVPPVLFAIHAPPGRDRLGGAPLIRKLVAISLFLSRRVLSGYPTITCAAQCVPLTAQPQRGVAIARENSCSESASLRCRARPNRFAGRSTNECSYYRSIEGESATDKEFVAH